MMDYKEAYYSLIERLKEAKEDNAICDERYCCVIDGLIQEQEENERIGKDIVSFLRSKNGYMTPNEDWDFHNRWLPWLEKQGKKQQGKSALEAIKEEKVDNTNKVEPNLKIEEGKYYVCIRNLDDRYGTRAFRKGDVYYSPKNGSLEPDNSNVPFAISCAEHYFRPWTVEDAKDGDILAGKIDGDSYILIFKQVKDGWVETYGHYYDSVDRFCVPSQLFCRDYQGTFIPATKEQRDALMKAMNDVGYEWDEEKKELRKIKQKSAWSEEDDVKLNDTINLIEQSGYVRNIREHYISWLQSLKQRATWKPSEEQIEVFEHFVRSIGESGYASPYDNNTKLLYSLLSDLKKL